MQRNGRSLEIFSDIAYAAGNGHRSIQGIAVFFGGSPVGWQSSQQAFVTHSTAESELVAYCESLLIGRASEALLCAMWGEPLKANQFSRVIYGDNLAAIGLGKWHYMLVLEDSALAYTCRHPQGSHRGVRGQPRWSMETASSEGVGIGGRWPHQTTQWSSIRQVCGGLGHQTACTSEGREVAWRR